MIPVMMLPDHKILKLMQMDTAKSSMVLKITVLRLRKPSINTNIVWKDFGNSLKGIQEAVSCEIWFFCYQHYFISDLLCFQKYFVCESNQLYIALSCALFPQSNLWKSIDCSISTSKPFIVVSIIFMWEIAEFEATFFIFFGRSRVLTCCHISAIYNPLNVGFKRYYYTRVYLFSCI